MKKLASPFTTCVTLITLSVAATPLANAASTTLTGTVRDFSPGPLVPGSTNPDFQIGTGGVNPGLVSTTLTGSAPTAVSFGPPGDITSPASFAEWYGPAAPSVPYEITLNETSQGSGIYSYTNNAFFPIDGQLLGNYGGSGHNYHFTYQISATFGYTPGAGQTFTFTGDDDVWVFFDKELGIDLGGLHGPASQSVNMDTLFGPNKAAGNYSFDLFFAERHELCSKLVYDER
ncbi:MAG: fibro-slime domain-containing protein [Nitrosospira sp.]|nr:fibro-slime domain-containing protein [Nitrosospira sp.]